MTLSCYETDFCVSESLPTPRWPPVLAAFAPGVNIMVSPGDTVKTFSRNHKGLLGRVIDIEPDHNAASASGIPFHPHLTLALDKTRPLIVLNY